MPYINKTDRWEIDDSEIGYFVPESPGELNYVITRLCHRFLDTRGRSYTEFNAVLGVLECAKLELYRRRMKEVREANAATN
jgi:hypothetical protein